MNNVIATLVGEKLEGEGEKWWQGTLASTPNGSVYSILPYIAPRVKKFNPVDKSLNDIAWTRLWWWTEVD